MCKECLTEPCMCMIVTYTNCKSCKCDRSFYISDVADRCKIKTCELCVKHIIVCKCERRCWVEKR